MTDIDVIEKPVADRPVLKFIRIEEVAKTTSLGMSTIQKKVKEKRFPASRTLGPQSVVWYEHEVIERMRSRPVSMGSN